ncbi:hypothetical protein QFC21_001324 [Naganishia friedmannii]|uniref:Uncharacterized protein n=1 Tax=Naganishia friedmannii TaxID=89922 RepID=A0ACC2W5P8_9TREE|nr:hypothetical protein QFC21_001324 [Naganishia friedmannii]
MTSLRDPSFRLRLAKPSTENNLSLVQRLQRKTPLRNTDSQRLTSLAWAALSGAEETFEWLLLVAKHDDKELSRDQEHGTILHLLASLPSPLSPTTSKKTVDLQKAAVGLTVLYWEAFPHLIDWENASGKTALHMACQSGNVDLVKTLCELGASYFLTDFQGNTPLHYASAWNQIECVRVLLDYGCPSGVRNNYGFTALEYAYSSTLAREFEDAIRDRSEGRKSRRVGGNTNPPETGGNGPDPHSLRYRPSYATLFSDDVASVAGSYNGGMGRLGLGYNGPTTPQQLQIVTTPEPKFLGSTFSYSGDISAANIGLGMGRIASASGTQSPMHRRISQRMAPNMTNSEPISPGTSVPSRTQYGGDFPPSPSGLRRQTSHNSLLGTATSTERERRQQQSEAEVPEVPSPTANKGNMSSLDLARPMKSLFRQASGNRSPSAISPTNTGGSGNFKWPRLPSRGQSHSEVMSRSGSVNSAGETPTRKGTLGIPSWMPRRESSPSVIEHADAKSPTSQQSETARRPPVLLGPPV